MTEKNSAAMARFGAEGIVALGKQVRNNISIFGAFGMSISQANDLLMEYAETQRMSGRASSITNSRTEQELSKLALASSITAQAFGKSREQIIQQTQDSMRNVDLQARMRGMSAEDQKMFQERMAGALTFLSGQAGEAGDALRKAFTAVAAHPENPHAVDNALVQALNESGLQNLVGLLSDTAENVLKTSDPKKQYEMVNNMVGIFKDQVDQMAPTMNRWQSAAARDVMQIVNNLQKSSKPYEEMSALVKQQNDGTKRLLDLQNQWAKATGELSIKIYQVVTPMLESINRGISQMEANGGLARLGAAFDKTIDSFVSIFSRSMGDGAGLEGMVTGFLGSIEKLASGISSIAKKFDDWNYGLGSLLAIFIGYKVAMGALSLAAKSLLTGALGAGGGAAKGALAASSAGAATGLQALTAAITGPAGLVAAIGMTGAALSVAATNFAKDIADNHPETARELATNPMLSAMSGDLGMAVAILRSAKDRSEDMIHMIAQETAGFNEKLNKLRQEREGLVSDLAKAVQSGDEFAIASLREKLHAKDNDVLAAEARVEQNARYTAIIQKQIEEDALRSKQAQLQASLDNARANGATADAIRQLESSLTANAANLKATQDRIVQMQQEYDSAKKKDDSQTESKLMAWANYLFSNSKSIQTTDPGSGQKVTSQTSTLFGDIGAMISRSLGLSSAAEARNAEQTRINSEALQNNTAATNEARQTDQQTQSAFARIGSFFGNVGESLSNALSMSAHASEAGSVRTEKAIGDLVDSTRHGSQQQTIERVAESAAKSVGPVENTVGNLDAQLAGATDEINNGNARLASGIGQVVQSLENMRKDGRDQTDVIAMLLNLLRKDTRETGTAIRNQGD
jgi:hypothetical protein